MYISKIHNSLIKGKHLCDIIALKLKSISYFKKRFTTELSPIKNFVIAVLSLYYITTSLF